MDTRWLTLAVAACGLVTGAGAADAPSLDERTTRAVLDYAQRIERATEELSAARRSITEQRAPLMDALRQAEDEVAALEADLARLEVERVRAAQKGQSLRADEVALDRNFSYITHVVLDGIKALEASVLPGEMSTWGGQAARLRQSIEDAPRPGDADAALEAAERLLERLRTQLGGYATPGSALRPGDNLVQPGTFVFAGPEVYFLGQDGTLFGIVRERRESAHVVAHPVPHWERAQAEALVRGELARVPIDGSGGRALRLLETRGGLWKELQKGGIVGYVIMGLGVVALVLVILKIRDLGQLQVDAPAALQPAWQALARGDRTAAQAMLPALRTTTRELLQTALRHADAPRSLLEEHLEGLVLRHRLHQERRLPLLAVIATSGPLLGLLGTVTGMIKTFTLITVFGTGSAGRLSGGISEALVATALGLAVAIPTLVVHGFLSHRIQKSVSLLERYALEAVTAIEESRAARVPLES